MTQEKLEAQGFDETSQLRLTPEEQKIRISELAEKYGVNERKLMLKCDLRIVPAICLLYLLAFLDRVNISNANVYGLATDLNLRGHEYNTALTIFFVPYIVSEIPSNYLLKKFKPHVWLTICMVLFGCVTIAQGFVRNFGGLVVTRFFLGLCEAGMFPGCFYLLSMWYRREEAQKRYSFFFSSTCLAGAFSGLIAAGIWRLDGKRGLEGWRWIFIIEGAVTVFCALLMFFCVSDFPEDASYLEENERLFIKEKLALDVGDSSHDVKITFKGILRVFKEWKIWFSGLMYFCLIIPAYGYAYFAAAIVKSLGHSPLKTQFYSVPPWVVAFGLSMIMAVFSDRLRHRFSFSFVCCLIAAAGFIMLLANKTNVHVRYAGLFLAASGLYTAMPILVCWTNMNFSGHHRKAISTAWQVSFGNIGGIIATFSFLAKDAPHYIKGVSIGLAFSLLAGILMIGYLLGLMYDNKKKRTPEAIAKWENLSPEEKRTAGDLSPYFFYDY